MLPARVASLSRMTTLTTPASATITRNCCSRVGICGSCCLYIFPDLPALVTGTQNWGSARQTHIQSSGQKGIPQHCDCCRTSNAPNNTISLDLMFASCGSDQRFFLIPIFFDLIQVPKRVVAFFNLRCTDGRLLGTAPKVNVAGDDPETVSLKRLDLLFETKVKGRRSR